MNTQQGSATPFPFRTGNYFLRPLKKDSFYRAAIGVAEKKDKAPLYIKFLDSKLSTNEKAIKQFQLEGKILNLLKGKQFPKYTEHGKVNDIHYIAYNYVKGMSLKALCSEKPAQIYKNPRFAVGVVSQILGALKYLHLCKEPVIHGNITPENIILGKKGHVYLVDFASAFFKKHSVMHTTAQCSTEYLSPEQAQGEQWLEQSDIFQVGVIFYELVTGKKWNTGSSTAEQILNAKNVCSLPDQFISPLVGSQLSQLIAQMLRPDPRTRVQTVNEAIQWLEGIISKEKISP